MIFMYHLQLQQKPDVDEIPKNLHRRSRSRMESSSKKIMVLFSELTLSIY